MNNEIGDKKCDFIWLRLVKIFGHFSVVLFRFEWGCFININEGLLRIFFERIGSVDLMQ